MPLLAGINRQQYEKIEKGGNPSLVTLDKIAEGLDAELMLIPKEKWQRSGACWRRQMTIRGRRAVRHPKIPHGE